MLIISQWKLNSYALFLRLYLTKSNTYIFSIPFHASSSFQMLHSGPLISIFLKLHFTIFGQTLLHFSTFELCLVLSSNKWDGLMPLLNSSKLEGCETKFRSDGSARGHQGELCLFLGVSGTNRPNSFGPAIRKDWLPVHYPSLLSLLTSEYVKQKCFSRSVRALKSKFILSALLHIPS